MPSDLIMTSAIMISRQFQTQPIPYKACEYMQQHVAPMESNSTVTMTVTCRLLVWRMPYQEAQKAKVDQC